MKFITVMDIQRNGCLSRRPVESFVEMPLPVRRYYEYICDVATYGTSVLGSNYRFDYMRNFERGTVRYTGHRL